MGTANLTEITVRGLKGSERYETTFDTNLPAFGVRCGRRSKTFVVVRGRGRERITLGHWPTMSVGDARAKAKKLLANDDEPKAARRGFRETREEFLETHYAGKADSTKYQVTRAFARHCGTLEGMQLAAIGDADIKRALDKLSDRPSEQLHLFRYLRTFFRWCQRSPRRYVKHSPMEGYEAPGRDRRKTRILSDDEIKAVWKASAKPQEAVVRLMLLWGTRRTETCVLERSWVAHEVLTIPGEHTKNRRAHAIPICPLADHSLPQHNYARFFPGRWGEGHLTPRGLSQIVTAVQHRSGTSNWTPHDLRRTFRSLAARVGVPREIAEQLMNHAPRVLDDIYDQWTYLPEKREALLRIEHALVWLLA